MRDSNPQALTGNGFQDRRITIILILRKILSTEHGAPRPYGRGNLWFSAESAEAFHKPAFAKATSGPSDAFILGLTPEVFCVGG